MAIYSLKETINYYKLRKTPIYTCFLDLSKAFDRVCHNKLWEKLRKRAVSEDIIAILSLWHTQQENIVKWSGKVSNAFYLKSGVRQGGSMSPVLFNIYMDELIQTLNSTKIGCHVQGVSVNNINYADDMVLLAPSLSALKKLLRICEEFAKNHNLLYNTSKSIVMVFKSKNEIMQIPSVWLDGRKMDVVRSVKYLGHIITDDLKDTEDMERQRRAISVRAGMLSRRFHLCSTNVKRTLFNAFCTSLYTSELWVDYTAFQWNKLKVSYNNAYRQLFRLPRYCSATEMFLEGRVHSFRALLRHCMGSLWRRLRQSDNTIITAIAAWVESPLMALWRQETVEFPP